MLHSHASLSPAMLRKRFYISFGMLLCATAPLSSVAQTAAHKTDHVIFVMSDGLRWQDVFHGADANLLKKEFVAVSALDALRREYWRDSPVERRQVLMPFLWSAIAENGQIYGNRDLGSDAYVTNGLNFSYPGYNEILCGFPDPRIHSNDKNENPNVSVLEWLNRKPAYQDKIAAFGAWDTFPFILNVKRSRLLVNSGYDALTVKPVTPRIELLNVLKRETGMWEDEPFDAPTFQTALEYLKLHKPRVLYLSLGETDDWAHEGKYDLYLKATHRVDQYLRELWETAQSIPGYQGHTTLVMAVDHGRGSSTETWKSHGEKIDDSKYVWMAFLGPDTPPLGERSKIAPVTQSQVAATLAALLGENYNAAVPKAGQPITDVLGH